MIFVRDGFSVLYNSVKKLGPYSETIAHTHDLNFHTENIEQHITLKTNIRHTLMTWWLRNEPQYSVSDLEKNITQFYLWLITLTIGITLVIGSIVNKYREGDNVSFFTNGMLIAGLVIILISWWSWGHGCHIAKEFIKDRWNLMRLCRNWHQFDHVAPSLEKTYDGICATHCAWQAWKRCRKIAKVEQEIQAKRRQAHATGFRSPSMDRRSCKKENRCKQAVVKRYTTMSRFGLISINLPDFIPLLFREQGPGGFDWNQ